MNQFLNQIRAPKTNIKTSKKVLHTTLILIVGICLGAFSKWLDLMSIQEEIWWQHIIGVLDLRNVFSLFGIWIVIALAISVYSSSPIRAAINVFLFFAGMNVTYHWYTIQFANFNPRSYMMIWYGITLVSPIAAFLCWYAKGKGKLAAGISMMIIAVMFLSSFHIGIWYLDGKSILDMLFFVITIGILYVSPKRSICSLGFGLLLAYFLPFLLPIAAIL